VVRVGESRSPTPPLAEGLPNKMRISIVQCSIHEMAGQCRGRRAGFQAGTYRPKGRRYIAQPHAGHCASLARETRRERRLL
jgi:hypothetical protein